MQTSASGAIYVPNNQRMNFLPYLFSRDYLNGELNIYAYAARYIEGYSGGMWQFCKLPNGGGYLAPTCKERYDICNPENWYNGTMSAEAAGIFITSLVLNHRCWLHYHNDEEELSQHYVNRFEQLREFIQTHPERAEIQAALD